MQTPDYRHHRIAHMKGTRHTARELYEASGSSLPFCAWEPPPWFDWSANNGTREVQITEGCGPDGCRVQFANEGDHKRASTDGEPPVFSLAEIRQGGGLLTTDR